MPAFLVRVIADVLPRSVNGDMLVAQLIRAARHRAVAHSRSTQGGSMLHRKVARWMPLVIAAFFVGRAAHAQTGRITGQVTDTAGGRPLAGVEITVVGEGDRAQVGARTDAAGRYTLGAVAAGSVQLRARMLGYAPKDRTVTVTRGADASPPTSRSRSAPSNSIKSSSPAPAAPSNGEPSATSSRASTRTKSSRPPHRAASSS